MFDDNQIAWLESELADAPKDKALLLAMHNPVYSADGYHHGSLYLTRVLDSAIERTGRIPDMFLAGHVHNYQRFTRTWKGRDIPYLVVGTGGFWQLYALPKVGGEKIKPPFPIPNTDVILENYCDDRHGYLRLEVSEQTLKADFLSVPRPQEAWSAPAVVQDSFTIDLRNHRLLR
jgi:3',5'-cyclic AMP phosphodiesterase CpdA